MEYKVGDKVRIRKDLIIDKVYGTQAFVSDMNKYLGKETTIRQVYDEDYALEIDKGSWYWTDEMLEPSTEYDFKVGDEVIIKPGRECSRPGVFTITSSYTEAGERFYRLNNSLTEGWSSANFLKVPLFKVGQIVQFKDITKDRWYTGTDVMTNLEGKLGIISEITEDNYTADKPGQDGCGYKVLYLQKETQGYVTSASLVPVPTIASLDDIKVTRGDDPGPRGDLGVITRDDSALAIAQAVDNVKGLQFKIGDTVVIKNDLIPGKEYNEWKGWIFRDEMAQYRGKIATIVGFRNCDSYYCSLDIDEKRWSWIADSLLPYTPGSDYDLDKQIINQQKTIKQNENRLQESEGNLVRGSECKGRAVCYQKDQIAAAIGHSCYTGKAIRR